MPRDPVLLDRARQLRRNPTDAEKKLWFHLRGRRMDGHRFRRQAPIGGYIADFACLGARLIVEIDGGQHNEPDNEVLDARRSDWLRSQGYRVLRFWNSQVLTEVDSVTETIYLALEDRSSEYRPPP